LIVGEESSKTWCVKSWDGSRLVNVIMSPGLGPVVTEILSKIFSGKSFLGGEDSRSESFSLSFVKGEDTGWLVFLSFSFSGEILNDGSHEDIVSVSLELDWDFSFVSGVTIVSWEEIGSSLLNEIIIRVRVGG